MRVVGYEVRHRILVLFACLSVALVLASVATAQAEAKVKCKVFFLHLGPTDQFSAGWTNGTLPTVCEKAVFAFQVSPDGKKWGHTVVVRNNIAPGKAGYPGNIGRMFGRLNLTPSVQVQKCWIRGRVTNEAKTQPWLYPPYAKGPSKKPDAMLKFKC